MSHAGHERPLPGTLPSLQTGYGTLITTFTKIPLYGVKGGAGSTCPHGYITLRNWRSPYGIKQGFIPLYSCRYPRLKNNTQRTRSPYPTAPSHFSCFFAASSNRTSTPARSEYVQQENLPRSTNEVSSGGVRAPRQEQSDFILICLFGEPTLLLEP